MARKEAMVQLTDELIAKLDAEAAKRRVSRSAVLREAVQKYFADEDAAIRAYIDGYTRIPQDTPDEWGSVLDVAAAAHEERLKELDEEERKAGFDPW